MKCATNQWSEGGNSYALINLIRLTLACMLPVSASFISIVGQFLVMFVKTSKLRLLFIVALVIGGVGASGQTYLLRHELVYTYPYKVMDADFYHSIAKVGAYFAPIVAVIAGFLLGLKRFWLATIVPVVFCPLLFAAIFMTFSFVRGELSGIGNATWHFDGETPVTAAQDFFLYSVSLATVGLIIGGICSFLLSWLLKERKLA